MHLRLFKVLFYYTMAKKLGGLKPKIPAIPLGGYRYVFGFGDKLSFNVCKAICDFFLIINLFC